MNDYYKILYTDIRHELANNRLPVCIGRMEEIYRTIRVISRLQSSNAIIVGNAGVGKTTLLYGFAATLAQNSHFKNDTIVAVNPLSLLRIGAAHISVLGKYQEAFAHIKNTVVILDEFGSAITSQPGAIQAITSVFQPILQKNNVRFVLSMTPEQQKFLEKQAPHFNHYFQTITVFEPKEITEILSSAIVKMSAANKMEFSVQKDALTELISLSGRFPQLGQLPKSGILILDECIAELKTKPAHVEEIHETNAIKRHLAITKAQAESQMITKDLLFKIISEKVDIPLHSLNKDEKYSLRELPEFLNAHIIGQKPAIAAISSVIQRAKLGLRNTARPLASFLVLGPSGVGKTETAKLLSSHLYGKAESFLRIDMSEFSEPHTVQRLIGAPPGYAGFDSGGQLTNHLQKFPYSLILLDEIEKSHSKIFDIFLQLLDDGRITSGQGETVQATQSIVMATSNLATNELLSAIQEGLTLEDQEAIKRVIFPILLQSFRAEFLNRFDAIVAFTPLSADHLTDIALLEIKKIEQRTSAYNISFSIDTLLLKKKVEQLRDPRFGARPIKRFVEELCENILTKTLLK